MTSQEFTRIMKMAAEHGFQAIRMNPHTFTDLFDIIEADVRIYLDTKQSKDSLLLLSDKDEIAQGISIKVDDIDRYFDLISFW